MNHMKGLRCTQCDFLHPVSIRYKCNRCCGSLNIEYEDSVFKKFGLLKEENKQGIWKYKNLLPVKYDVEPVTLGEGNTPILYSSAISKRIENGNIYLKLESSNPTLSFKDRPNSVAFTVAKQFNVEKVVTASTGNTGVSVAAYAARAGIPCEVYVPEHTPIEKVKMIEFYGATIKLTKGTFSDAYNLASQVALENNWFNLTSTFLNPFAIEGDKTLAYEIYEQFDGKVPEWILIPVGAGPLLVACYKGFEELKFAGLIKELPKMVAIQAENCSPIVQAFNNGFNNVVPWKGSDKTIASGIADPLTSYAEDGTRTLDTIRKSDGYAVAVSEECIRESQIFLAKEEGVFAEPSSVTAVGALDVLKDVIKENDNVVCVITGHGVKDLDVIN